MSRSSKSVLFHPHPHPYLHLHLHRSILVVLFLLAVAFAPSAGAQELPRVESRYTPDADGAVILQCRCLLATSGCQNDLFWHLFGDVHGWSQKAHLKAGKAIDVDRLCYNKRDVDKLGDGLCCAVPTKDGKPDEERLHRVFGVTEIN